MSTFGLRVRNSAGVLQIDGQNQNFCLLSKGSVSFSAASFGAGSIRSATITVTATNPILVLSSPSRCTVLRTANSGTSWTFVVTSTQAAAGDTLNYYVFDRAAALPAPGTGYGLRLRDASGNVIYDTRLKPLRVAGLISSGGTTSLTVPSGRTYGVCQCKQGFQHAVVYLNGSTGSGGAPHSGAASGSSSTGSSTTRYAGAGVTGGSLAAAFDGYESYLLYDHGESSFSSSDWLFLAIDLTDY